MANLLDSKRYGLALHTTSPELGLAISNFADETRSTVWNLGQNLSTHLHEYLAEFIQPQTWTDLAFVAVAKGPGSFTGTRIGVVTARTIAQQLEIPLFAISTLAAQARSHRKPETQDLAIAVEMPASRGEVFVGIYQNSPDDVGQIQLLPDRVMKPDAWQKTLEEFTLPYQLVKVADKLGSSVSSLLELAYLDWQKGLRTHWSEALPFYGQHPIEDKNAGDRRQEAEGRRQ